MTVTPESGRALYVTHRRHRGESPAGMVTVTLFSVFALLASLFGLLLYATDDHGASRTAATAAGATKTFDITLEDLDIVPSSININAGDTVVLNVTNNAEHGGSQALDLQPAQGGFVELTFAKQGKYAMVTHKFANPGRAHSATSRPARRSTTWAGTRSAGLGR